MMTRFELRDSGFPLTAEGSESRIQTRWFMAGRRLAEDAAIGYKMLRATGKKGPQCDKNPQSLLCQQKGIRDRDFNTSIPDVVRTVTSARSFVFRKKYHVML